MELYNQLREKHKRFIYHSYTIEKDGFSFDFSIDEYHFYPKWTFDEKYLQNPHNKQLVEYIIFSLGMVELVSYWKCACPPVVEIKCGALDNEQILWWKKLYYNGLGEFFYKNNIHTSLNDFMEIHCENSNLPHFALDKKLDGFLIPVGGGKDSIVTMELLKQYQNKNLCYIINPRGATLNCAHTAEYEDSQIVGVKRTIDTTLIKLNADGYLNGHTPFSSIVAFSSYLFAYLTGKKYIALSNESSANEANVSGTEINHQYSKSTEFEEDFRNYSQKYFLSEIEYFSMLRPWSEWQIAKKFVTYPKYFSVFQSCNVGSKTDTWCGKCAKCLYVYIMLSAFLDDNVLVKIFGLNMLDNAEFKSMFKGLISDNFDKPFECVGTRDEVNLALQTAVKRRKELPVLLAEYVKENNTQPADLDSFFDEKNFVPNEFIGLLKY